MAICPHASLASGGSQPPGVTSGPSGLQVGLPCLVGWALRWGLGVCSFRPWAISLLGFRCGRTPAQNRASGGHVTWFSYLSRLAPDYVLFCSLDDDSDLYSPRYSFSEDSK